jgi:hypothetical protein
MMSFATILNTSLESTKDIQLYYHYNPDDDWEIDEKNIITFPQDSDSNVTFQIKETRETFETTNMFLTESFHKLKNNVEIHSHEFVIENKDTNGNSLFLVFFVHSQSIYPSSELDLLFHSESENDFLESFLTKHLYDQPNLFYKTKHSKIIVLPTMIRVNSLSAFSVCSRKQMKKKYKELYDTDFYEPIFSLFRTSENDEEPYLNKILAENVPLKAQLIVEGFKKKKRPIAGRTGHKNRGRGISRRLRLGRKRRGGRSKTSNNGFTFTGADISGAPIYQECTMLKDDGKSLYMETAVVPLNANASSNGTALFMNFLYFILIFIVVGIFCPYLTIYGIADKNHAIKVWLCIINYLFLVTGIIILVLGIVGNSKAKGKKLRLDQRILMANLGLYFIIIWVVSLLSNYFAFKAKINFGGNLDFSRVNKNNYYPFFYGLECTFT